MYGGACFIISSTSLTIPFHKSTSTLELHCLTEILIKHRSNNIFPFPNRFPLPVSHILFVFLYFNAFFLITFLVLQLHRTQKVYSNFNNFGRNVSWLFKEPYLFIFSGKDFKISTLCTFCQFLSVLYFLRQFFKDFERSM